MIMNGSNKKARRLALLALIATMPMATGCSSNGLSMASMNPFSKGEAAVSPPAMTTPDSTGVKGQLASFGKSTKNVFSKASSVFNRDKDLANSATATDDPLSLNNMPEQVDPSVHVANGQLWESTGDPKKAAESYQRALAVDPNFGPALSNLARLNYRQGNYPVAAQNFQAALKESPNDAQLYNELGLTLNKLGRTDMAITVMQRALTLAPGTSRYANSLATVMHESGNPKGAYEVLVKNNKPAVAHFNMAYLQFKSGNVGDAQRHLNETMKFEAVASQDPAVARAVDRSKGMLAQIAAFNKGQPAAGSVASTAKPSPKTPSPSKRLPSADKPVTTKPAVNSSTPEARVATHTAPATARSTDVPFGFGWPTSDTTDGSAVKKASGKMPAETPSWLEAFEQSDSSADSVPPPKTLRR